jgi:hypothetical protein
MKKTFIVGAREVHVRHYSVQAENEEEAKDLVYQMADSVADIDMEEYSHCLDRDTWSVEEVPDKDGSPGQHLEGAQP